MYYNYTKWRLLVDAVSKIRDEMWDKWLPKLGYDKNTRVIDIDKEHYDFICELIDCKLWNYFEGEFKLEVRNGFLPGWNYKRRF